MGGGVSLTATASVIGRAQREGGWVVGLHVKQLAGSKRLPGRPGS